MVDSVLVKCQYCNTAVLLRFQMGYFDIPKVKYRTLGVQKLLWP